MIMSGSRLNVLFLVESLAGGGAEKILSGLVRGLDRDKFNVTVCAVVDCGQYRDEVRKHARYRFIVGGRGCLYRLKYALVYRFLPAGWIYKWFIAGDYDVEAAFTEGLPAGGRACGKARKGREDQENSLGACGSGSQALDTRSGIPVAGRGKKGLWPFPRGGPCVADGERGF